MAPSSNDHGSRISKARRSKQPHGRTLVTPKPVGRVRTNTNIVRANGQIKFRAKRRAAAAEDLRDEDWKKIAASSPLPEDARFRIVGAIAIYRDLVSAERTDLSSKRLVQRMRRQIAKLVGDAAKLNKDPVFFRAGLPMWSRRTGPVPADIEKLIEEFMVLDQILADAQDRMAMSPGRKSSDPLGFLIDILADIQAEATKRFVKRSIKNGTQLRPTNTFIRLCVGVADPQIPNSLIENVLAKCIARHHKDREIEGFNTDEYDPRTE